MTFRKSMAVLILFGVLLTGIGAGIGFAEYSEMEYQGHVSLAGEEMQTKHLVWELGTEKYDTLRPYLYWASNDIKVTEDKTVPRDEVWFDVTYASAYGEIYLGHTEVYEDTGSSRGKTAEVGVYWKDGLEFEEMMQLLMECRDQLLGELKQHKFSTYDFDRSYDVEIRINPANAKLLDVMW
ncbi:MAG: hypothetical protein ACLVEV_10705 [Lachnospiraceae bacterium]|uniref:hypothetical protein n=1 Tax=Parablautia sp. Marseille-Q6255 TaxID=3039593 RepID=UPI0024BC10CF|nr:hypothetical protein [Parablautia sp. Marseille-Q6255]